MALAQVARAETELPGLRFMSSPKVVLFVHARPPGSPPGVLAGGGADHVKLSFRRSGAKERLAPFVTALEHAVAARAWCRPAAGAAATTLGAAAAAGNGGGGGGGIAARGPGILGLQRAKTEQLKSADATIRAAFQGDLKALMAKAKDMVSLAER